MVEIVLAFRKEKVKRANKKYTQSIYSLLGTSSPSFPKD
jgi:hypothetical protein